MNSPVSQSRVIDITSFNGQPTFRVVLDSIIHRPLTGRPDDYVLLSHRATDPTAHVVVKVRVGVAQPGEFDRYRAVAKYLAEQRTATAFAQDNGAQHIINFLGFAVTRDHLYLAMECTNQGTLDEAVKHVYRSNLRLAVSQVRHVIAGVTKGVEYLHRLGIAHRAIRPEHVLLDGDRMLLCGFSSVEFSEKVHAQYGALAELMSSYCEEDRKAIATLCVKISAPNLEEYKSVASYPNRDAYWWERYHQRRKEVRDITDHQEMRHFVDHIERPHLYATRAVSEHAFLDPSNTSESLVHRSGYAHPNYGPAPAHLGL